MMRTGHLHGGIASVGDLLDAGFCSGLRPRQNFWRFAALDARKTYRGADHCWQRVRSLARS